MDRAYGPCAEAALEMDVPGKTGTLAEILAFCRA